MNNKKRKTTSRLLGISLLQYSILIPFMRYISSSVLVSITSMLLIFLLLFVNRSIIISRPVYYIAFGIIILLLFKALIEHAELSTVFYAFLFVLPTLLMFIYPYDHKEFLDFSILLSKIAFIFLFWIPFSSSFYTSYMRFGYGMLPIVILAYIDITYLGKKNNGNFEQNKYVKKILNIIIIIVGSVELLFFGARGATFALLLFFVLDRIIYNKEHVAKNILILGLSFIAYLNIDKIFSLIDVIMVKFGISSYSIMKFERQLARGFAAASSSRDQLYLNSFEMIKKSPLLGNTIEIDETGGDYVHNIFLQVTQDFGIFMLFILIVFVVYCMLQISREKNSKYDRLMILTLFSISFGRLMFSSTIWRRPEFWMLVCVVAKMFGNNRKISKSFKTKHSFLRIK